MDQEKPTLRELTTKNDDLSHPVRKKNRTKNFTSQSEVNRIIMLYFRNYQPLLIKCQKFSYKGFVVEIWKKSYFPGKFTSISGYVDEEGKFVNGGTGDSEATAKTMILDGARPFWRDQLGNNVMHEAAARGLPWVQIFFTMKMKTKNFIAWDFFKISVPILNPWKNETVKLILKLYPECLEIEGQYDNTALTMAMMKDQRDTIKLLIDQVERKWNFKLQI